MSSLSEKLLDPGVRPKLVEALASDVDAEVNAQSGIGGMAVKTAYKGATKVKSGIVGEAINAMLPRLCEQFQPMWDAKGAQSFSAYLTQNSSQAADSVLEIADEYAARADYPAVSKIYNGMRSKAKGYVESSLPRLGSTVERFMA